MRSVGLAMLFGVVVLFSPGAILANPCEEASESEIIWPGRLQPITLWAPRAVLAAAETCSTEAGVFVAPSACKHSPEGQPYGCPAVRVDGVEPDGDGANTLKGDFGIIYIRPYWSRNNFSISLPTPTGTFVGDTRDVTQAFNLSPILRFHINSPDIPFGLSMSGYMIQFGSALNRNIANPIGDANLTSTNALSLWVANLPEFTYPHDKKSTIHGFVFHAGFRYNQIQQSYSATLTSSSANASSNLQSFQKFTGFGGTCALEWTSAIKDPNKACLCLFSEIRGSATVGNNQRSSSFVSSPLVAQANNSISESRVSLVPVGELYAGLEFVCPTHSFYVSNRSGKSSITKVTVRMGCTGQIWGDVGMPSAVGNNQPNNGSLYLVGFLVAGGFNF